MQEILKKNSYILNIGESWGSDVENDITIVAFDHENLNVKVAEFKNLNPTVENISVVIYDKSEQKLELH